MPDVITIARPYAKAVFSLALEQKQLKEWSHALKKLALIASDKNMKPVLTSPLVSKDQLVDLFIDIAGKSLDQQGKNLVTDLAAKKRLALLPAISQVYETYLADHERLIDVKVVSAYPIDEARIHKLQNALAHLLNRKVNMYCSVDNNILGSAIIYVGDDQVIDGSIRGKLNLLSKRLSI